MAESEEGVVDIQKSELRELVEEEVEKRVSEIKSERLHEENDDKDINA